MKFGRITPSGLIGMAVCTYIITGALTIGSFFLGDIFSKPETLRRFICQSNLKQLSIALEQYHDKYKEYPDRLSRIYPEILEETSIFVCPCSYDKIKEGEIEEVRSSIERDGSYAYFPPNENSREEDIIFAEKRLSNHKKGIFASNYDSGTYWIGEKERNYWHDVAVAAGGFAAGGLVGFLIGRRK